MVVLSYIRGHRLHTGGGWKSTRFEREKYLIWMYEMLWGGFDVQPSMGPAASRIYAAAAAAAEFRARKQTVIACRSGAPCLPVELVKTLTSWLSW